MLARSPEGRGVDATGVAPHALPPPEVAEFIRYSHRRRHAGWPEIYDDMCAIAARREFKGWDSDRLAEAGVSFTLFDTPRLAAWVRAVIPADVAARQSSQPEPNARVAVGPGVPESEPAKVEVTPAAR